jgi:hypothetical protein
MTFPMVINVWADSFENVEPVDGPSDLNPPVTLETARYLPLRPDLDPQRQAHSRGVLRRVESTFGRPRFGALTNGEPPTFPHPHPTGSHTGRYVSVGARSRTSR